MAFASRVAERLCQLVVEYYEGLLSGIPAAMQAARDSALRKDLRNWDLDTGYTGYYVEVTPGGAAGQQTRLRLRHSWYHFLDLVPREATQRG